MGAPMTGTQRLATLLLLTAAFALGLSHVARAEHLIPVQVPLLREACAEDYRRLCWGVPPGGGRIVLCLNAHADQLSQGATGAGCNVCSTTQARLAPRTVRRSKATNCSRAAGKGRTGTSRRSDASAALGSGVARVRPGRVRLAEHDADLPLFDVAIRVNETEDARRGAKPFGALFERPDCVRLRQPIDQALNEEIRPGAIGLLGRDDLRPEQLQRRRALADFDRWQFNAGRLERNASAICVG